MTNRLYQERPRQYGKTAASPQPQTFPGSQNKLTDLQKSKICCLASKAYKVQKASASGMTVEEFRRQQQLEAVGKESLTDCTQADYRTLVRVFSVLAGYMKQAFRTALKEGFEDRDQALHRLRQEIVKARDVIPNPESWCRGFLKNKRGTIHLESADAADLWHIVKTLSSRAADLRKKPRTVTP